MGNHERMMLDFLARPVTAAPRWLSAGGQETLHSFGIRVGFSGLPPERRYAAQAEALRAALAPDLLNWITNLPLFWQDQGVAVVHAAAKPNQSLASQPEATLLWGKPPRGPRADGMWLVHGHIIVPQVRIQPGRIAVDTGAWHSGRLSAIWIDRHGPRNLTDDRPDQR
jgi:serine/threonine protein phosphatase 1